MSERIADIMSRTAIVVDPLTPASDARLLADQRGVHHLLVLEGQMLVGVICRCELDWAFEGDTVARLMRAPLLSVSAEATCRDAATLMLERRVGCLPVLDGTGNLRGVVTRSDLRRAGCLPGERGIDCCAACGTGHCLLAAGCPDTPVFCFDCLDQVRGNGVREPYFTLGGGD